MSQMSGIEQLLTRLKDAPFEAGQPATPRLRLTVLTCMDARIDPYSLLGLTDGDAHVIRNAGGIATDDAIRSIAMSQRLLETKAVLVIQHTGCGIHVVAPEDFERQVREETGVPHEWKAPVMPTPEETLEQTLSILRSAEAIPHRDLIAGTVLDLAGRTITAASVD